MLCTNVKVDSQRTDSVSAVPHQTHMPSVMAA